MPAGDIEAGAFFHLSCRPYSWWALGCSYTSSGRCQGCSGVAEESKVQAVVGLPRVGLGGTGEAGEEGARPARLPVGTRSECRRRTGHVKPPDLHSAPEQTHL